MMNIICDKLAGATTQAALAGGNAQGRVLLDLPYAGSKVMLKIKNTYITSRYLDKLYRARRSVPMREYCDQKYIWTDEVFDLIHWASVGQVRRKLSDTMKRQTCKIMHDWIPTGYMRKWTGEETHCPGCKEPTENLRHLWQCPSLRMRGKRKAIIISAKKIGKKNRTPQHILKAFLHVLLCKMQGIGNPVKDTCDTHLKTAIQA